MGLGLYARLREERGDDPELAACIDRVVNQLEEVATTGDRPGMLLGKIQSGKTRAFVGAIARAFDRGFEIAIVLTKGTKTLSAQTVARLKDDFADFIEEDEMIVLDIMKLPGKLTKSELKRKIVIVAKKQAQNLRRLTEFIETNESLKNRRVLLVDDEADLASIRFIKKKDQDDIEQGKIAEQMDALRRMVDGIAFLQVTATPYSLYLQPEGYEAAITRGDYVFKPKKPAFTELLPIHSGYVGGDDFFGSFDESDPRSRLYVEVSKQEQDALRHPDRRRIHPDRVLESSITKGIRRAIVTFILASIVRRWQQQEAGERKRKYAMVIHNDTQKEAHKWQEQVINWIFEAIITAADKDADNLLPTFNEAFDDLAMSVSADGGRMPPRSEAFTSFIDALQSDEVMREKVNSDADVMALLDHKAELHLRTPFNIFVGGNILDRGITIPNLIAFYYGRNPKTMQADTVLQHSRMYGNRNRRDLAATRFYTSRDVYSRLYTINTFENALREAFETQAHDRGVVFIQTDSANGVKPCAPNKVLVSNIVAIRPNSLFLPTSFQTKGGPAMIKAQTTLDALIKPSWRDTGRFIATDKSMAINIINEIEPTFEFDDDEFEWDAMRALIEYYSSLNGGEDGKILLLGVTDRGLTREKSGDKSGLSILGGGVIRAKVLDPARSSPALILLQQKGDKLSGWSGHKFWWPILAAPATAEPCVFASKVAD